MSRRGVIATSVLVAWGAGLAVLTARVLNPSPAARLAEAALRVVPMTSFYVVEDRGRHVGFASIAFDTVPNALQVTEYLVTESVPGERFMDQLAVRLSRGLALREYESLTARGPDTTRMRATLTDSTLLVYASGGAADRFVVPVPVFAGVLGATVSVLLDPPKVGMTRTLAAIDPATGRVHSRSLRVAAESLFVVVDSAVADSSGRWFAVHKDTVRAWRMVATETPVVDAWMDAQGLVVESRLPNGLVLRRTAFELAFENWRLAHPERAVAARGGGSVVSGTWLASGVPAPSEPLDTLFVRFGASTPKDLDRLLGRAYRAGATLRLARLDESRVASRYALPTSEAWQKVFAKELAPDPAVDSDHPGIAQRARRIASTERDPSAIARSIVRWVHDSVSAEAGSPAPTASAVIGRGSGDAREFAIATAALARAAGIPAQPVSGLLFHNGRFYLHVWTEINVGRWIPVDAMLGQFPADARHVPFLSGAADPGPDLARVLTRLDLTVQRTVPSREPPTP